MKEIKIVVDKKLTLENAKKNGYEYVRNIIYDPEAPKEANKEITDLVKSGNYKLGVGMTEFPDLFVGLYKKL